MTIPANPVKPSPVPWVPVEIAPASDCGSTSPWLASARPCGASSAGMSRSRVPARKRTRRVAASTATIPLSASREIMVPVSSATGVKECPAPMTRIRSPLPFAAATTAASSDSSAGAWNAAGWACAVPDQVLTRRARPVPPVGAPVSAPIRNLDTSTMSR